MLTWHYRRFFSCDSKDALYVLICNNCDFFYIGQTEELKQRIRKHKSGVIRMSNRIASSAINDQFDEW